MVLFITIALIIGVIVPAVTVWDNADKTVVRAELSGDWTWDERAQSVREAVDMMRSVSHQVDLIAIHHNNRIPSGAMLQGRRLLNAMPDNWGFMVIVSGGFIRSMIMLLKQVSGSQGERILVAASLEEARILLTQQRTGHG